jgi:hypothetical protein
MFNFQNCHLLQVDLPTVHIIGHKDFIKEHSITLVRDITVTSSPRGRRGLPLLPRLSSDVTDMHVPLLSSLAQCLAKPHAEFVGAGGRDAAASALQPGPPFLNLRPLNTLRSLPLTHACAGWAHVTRP